MHAGREEIIVQFRHTISSRYKRTGLFAVMSCAAGILLAVTFSNVAFVTILAGCLNVLGLMLAWYSFNHRYQMLNHFDIQFDDANVRLEKYFEAKQSRWERFSLYRIALMSGIGLAMLVSLFFWKESAWTRIFTSAFIALTLALLVKGWMDFNDEILRHDIMRSLRD